MVTGLVIGLLSWFGIKDDRRELVVDYLLREEITDGGWNCQRRLIHSVKTAGSPEECSG
jgi:hypothetical protein